MLESYYKDLLAKYYYKSRMVKCGKFLRLAIKLRKYRARAVRDEKQYSVPSYLRERTEDYQSYPNLKAQNKGLIVRLFADVRAKSNGKKIMITST